MCKKLKVARKNKMGLKNWNKQTEDVGDKWSFENKNFEFLNLLAFLLSPQN